MNRFYDSGQGRFTQADPLGLGAVNLSDPQSLNMYAYCGNDPVNRLDPSGLFWGWLTRLIRSIFGSYSFRRAVVRSVITFVTSGNLRQAIREGIEVYGQEVLRGWTTSIARTTPTTWPGSGTGVSGLSRYLIQHPDWPKIRGANQEQLALILAALSDLVDRINKNKGDNDCARLFGGKDKALKALKKSTVKVAPIFTQIVVPESGPFAGRILGSPTVRNARTDGTTITLGSNTILAPEGKMSVYNVATGMMIEIPTTPTDATKLSSVLAHELAHRTDAKGIVKNDDDPDINDRNQEKVDKACGY